MKKDLPVYDLELTDEQDFGVFAISIVDDPAIKSDYVMLSSQEKQVMTFAEVDKAKQILLGAVMIPNREIFRKDVESGEEFYVRFPQRTVTNSMYRFGEQKNHSEITLMHDKKVVNVSVVESWEVVDPKRDKSAVYGLDAPQGSWVVGMKVKDKEDYEALLRSTMRGFSLEGKFNPVLSNKPAVNVAAKSHKDGTEVAAKRLLSLSGLFPNMDR